MRASKLIAVAAAAGGLLAGPAVARATTVVTPGAGGTLTFTDGEGGTGSNGVMLRTSAVEPSRLYIFKSAAIHFADPDSLELSGTELGCVDGSPLLIVCDSPLIDLIDVRLGDGADSVDTRGVSRVGDQFPDDPPVEGPAAIRVNLGAGDDRFDGGPLREEIRDGTGGDLIAAGGGFDLIVQPDSADPGTDDRGDRLDPGTGTDVISYAGRRQGQGVGVALDGSSGDGAPGENDIVWPGEVVELLGTNYADTLTGTEGTDILDGRAGDDVIDGRSGDDTLAGGPGEDTITGGAGVDVVTADLASGGYDDTIRTDDGEADGRVVCGRGADTVVADPDLLDGLLEPIGGFPLPIPLPRSTGSAARA